MKSMKSHLPTLLLAMLAATATAAPLPDQLRFPPQPFTVELLDQERGRWEFAEVLGQKLKLAGPVRLTGFAATDRFEVGILLEHPEFPGDAAQAELQTPPRQADGSRKIDYPWFKANLALRRDADGRVTGELTGLELNGATPNDRFIGGLYLIEDGRVTPLLLTGPADDYKLQTGRVGGVFKADEPVELKLSIPEPGTVSRRLTADITVRDYYSGKEELRMKHDITTVPGAIAVSEPVLPLTRFGSFEAEAAIDGKLLRRRITRIPSPRAVSPADSFMGMNIFQQQIWYYAYQLPLYADAGIRWIRPWLRWENTWGMQEPAEGKFTTDALDAMLRRLKKYNQKYEYVLYHYPKWLSPSDMTPLDETGFAKWEKYVDTLARRYRGEIDTYEVWNEPDLLNDHSDGRFSPEFYAELFKRTSRVLKQVDPAIQVQALSHALRLPWLDRIGATDMARYADAVTLHTYSPSALFAMTESLRQNALDRNGFFDKPQWFNEIGVSAYDSNPAYSAKYLNSEKIQAEQLVINYAQSLHFAGSGGKTFWFCSYDPRDSNNPAQWSWDSGIGLMYLGFQPKTAFAALAATARMLDGRKCLGRTENGPLRQVSFSGPMAVVWSENPAAAPVPAVRLGCRPEEEITLHDLFGNPIASGKAEELTVELTRSPVFLGNSAALAEAATEQRTAWMNRRRAAVAANRLFDEFTAPLRLAPGESRELVIPIPPGTVATLETTRQLPLTGQILMKNNRFRLTLRADAAGTGTLKLRLTLPELPELPDVPAGTVVERFLPVEIGRDNFFHDGAFFTGNLGALFFEQYSRAEFDPSQGAADPGCLKQFGPFQTRVQHQRTGIKFRPDRPLEFSVALKGQLSTDVELSFNVAFFAGNRWLGTWCAARNAASASPDSFRQTPAAIPAVSDAWTTVRAVLPGELIPAATNRMIFFTDLKGGGEADLLLLDDFELYQPNR